MEISRPKLISAHVTSKSGVASEIAPVETETPEYYIFKLPYRPGDHFVVRFLLPAEGGDTQDVNWKFDVNKQWWRRAWSRFLNLLGVRKEENTIDFEILKTFVMPTDGTFQCQINGRSRQIDLGPSLGSEKG